jgi:hypothetical protein
MHVSPDHLLVAGRADSRDLPAVMIDREKVVAILRKRFPNAPAVDIAAAANAIVGLGDEWREVENFESDVEQQLGKCTCGELTGVLAQIAEGRRFKLYEHID